MLLIAIESFGNDPWSHSLVKAIVYSCATITIAFIFTKDQKSAILMGAVVMSHWILEFIDWNYLPLAFEKKPSLGLELCPMIGFCINVSILNSAMAIVTGLELVLLILGFLIFLNSKKVYSANKLA